MLRKVSPQQIQAMEGHGRERSLLGTFACLVIVMAVVALAAHWPALFWLLVLSVSLYLLFGRKAEVEFRLGVGGAEERRLYGTLVWKARDRLQERADEAESDEYEAGIAGRDG